MTVRIVTDSACDLRGDEVADYGIEVVPLSIRFGDKEYVDREELTVSEFYRLLEASEELPETAAPAPEAQPLVKEADPELEKLLDEEEAIAKRTAAGETNEGPRMRGSD